MAKVKTAAASGIPLEGVSVPADGQERETVLEGAIVRYLGDGSAFVGGVPTRDLTFEEWGVLSDAERQVCLASGLYTVAGDVTPAKDNHATT